MWIRGNVCAGQRMNNPFGGSSGDSASAAIMVQGTPSTDVRIHGNIFSDTHTACLSGSDALASRIDFTANLCELDPDGVSSYSAAHEQGGVWARFEDSRIAFNIFKCEGPGISWVVTEDGQTPDIKYNLPIDCDAADANNRASTPCTDCADSNMLRDTLAGGADVNETTDSDEQEFRPALAARDGKPYEPGLIPDGFYTVGDTPNPQPEFQAAIIAAVDRGRKVLDSIH